jgi:hypothetical protein
MLISRANCKILLKYMSDQEEEKVPLFKNWQTWYWVVILFLFSLIGAFYLLTKFFS